MTDPLARIEGQLLAAARRRAASRRVRRRALAVAAIAAALLAAASVASAISGIGPVAGVFEDDDFAPPHARPAPGGRRALLSASAAGERWDVLVYRRSGSLTRVAGVRDYCVAAARGSVRSIGCEYPATLAARVMRKGFELRSAGREGARTVPVFGLARGDVRSVSVRAPGSPARRAELSRPFRLVVPRLSQRARDRIESPSQQRATRGLPASVPVRAFLAVVVPGPPPTSINVSAEFPGGHVKRDALAIREPLRLPAPDMSPAPGRPRVRIAAGGWEMRGFETRDGNICIAGARPGVDPPRSLACAPTGHVAGRLGGTYWNRPDSVRGLDTYPVYGVVRASAARAVVVDPLGRTYRARLSRPWTRLGRTRVRGFVAAVRAAPPPGRRPGVRLRVSPKR